MTVAARTFASTAPFQSSPALTGGCYGPAERRRPYQRDVSILTRPYGRMLCRSIASGCSSSSCFNPHPPLRADAMARNSHPFYRSAHVSILTRPYGRMLWSCFLGKSRFTQVSILTRPYGRMLCAEYVARHCPATVSILTRPYGRMLWAEAHRDRDDALVSILTRPYGRMLCRRPCNSPC